MIKNFKAALFSIAFALLLLITGCSSTENSSPAAEVDSIEIQTSGPAAMEDRVYQKSVEEKEEAEKLKKQKTSDDDMERLD
ncbi:hypothetical protein [Alkalimarinus sediminis]|uniref:Secreted protein n=1 Tax=Alkalimarinus sediminis TaxID=1632866 RepID=A0A9E8HK19_9ALTE|nr:hypothetical protein [Alkalimarinus sediminis]UZW74787.1 hypothetical protein NNL22_17475 [Alkalimarinus sediminis]